MKILELTALELSEKIKDVTEKIARNIYTMAVRLDTAGKEIYNNEDVQEFIEKTQTVNRVRQKRLDWQIAEFRAAHENELEEFAERVEAIKKKYKELENEHDEDINELKESDKHIEKQTHIKMSFLFFATK